MGISKYIPHLLILPEDDAVRQIVVGFLLDDRIDLRHVQQLPVLGGWRKVMDTFLNDYAEKMRFLPNRHMLLVIDCDDVDKRIPQLQQEIPLEIRDRVFILGSIKDPEALARSTRQSKEIIGRQLAAECADGEEELWSHEHLRHNESEVVRLTGIVVPFIFAR